MWMVKRTTSLFNLFCTKVVKRDVSVARFTEAKVSGIKLETEDCTPVSC